MNQPPLLTFNYGWDILSAEEKLKGELNLASRERL
jgi:hypothetical protein